MQHRGYFYKVQMTLELVLKPPQLDYSIYFKINRQQTYMGVKFLCWMDERYAHIQYNPLSPNTTHTHITKGTTQSFRYGWLK